MARWFRPLSALALVGLLAACVPHHGSYRSPYTGGGWGNRAYSYNSYQPAWRPSGGWGGSGWGHHRGWR
jgi:hypothetical protein